MVIAALAAGSLAGLGTLLTERTQKMVEGRRRKTSPAEEPDASAFEQDPLGKVAIHVEHSSGVQVVTEDGAKGVQFVHCTFGPSVPLPDLGADVDRPR
ncbi:hypothetical protein [Nonomuraea sp. NPDC050643]|uniref:hypothetical protein n=1 Tax=Nonomuraea sp. NPDC050643 TaxID=3155660 RepID=UPI0033FFDC91